MMTSIPALGKNPEGSRRTLPGLVSLEPASAQTGGQDGSLTAASLMVSPVQSVLSSTSVREAQQRLDRYALGAMPVLAVVNGAATAGRVVGLVTRRLLGALLQHGLGEFPVERFMTEAACVLPSTDLDAIFDLIQRKNPRLVVVVESFEGGMLGVFTRTQVLRTLAGLHSTPRMSSGGLKRPPSGPLGVRLEALPEWQQEVVNAASELVAASQKSFGLACAIVGGIVRDLLLGRPSDDLDLMVEGTAEAIDRFVEGLRTRLGAQRLDHGRFGTASLALPTGQHVDVATARLEYYVQPAALPTVEPGSLIVDLKRRDFTINSLALRLGLGEVPQLMDPLGGLSDLQTGAVRILHPVSFIDDPTRIFRAVRFEQRLGFCIEPETERFLREAIQLGLLEKLSGERLSAELESILKEATHAAPYRRLDALGLLPSLRLHPLEGWQEQALGRLAEAIARVEDSAASLPFVTPLAPLWLLRLLVWMLNLSTDALSGTLARLALRGALAERLKRAHGQARPLLSALRPGLAVTARSLDGQDSKADGGTQARVGLLPSELCQLLDPEPPETLVILLAMGNDEVRPALEAYLNRFRLVRPPLSGHALMAAGFKPGPQLKRLLTEARALALDLGLDAKQVLERLKSRCESEV